MILSVVIVSYNVKYFLEQCLSSLQKAIDGISATDGSTEVFIIDNASGDGTPDFLEPLFPHFQFIRNKENVGFARANNLVIPLCKGEFILFLNPDTILAEDSLDACIKFSREHTEAGAVGVRMVDGTGRFLKESKRGFPYPSASFFKMTGFARLFPRSKFFSSYYMGHLDQDRTQVVDVLSGAFMMIKKYVLDKTGAFDERFFMYAEDIDLSYRIEKAGFKNYYLPLATIIHFKGESTQKDARYVKVFYSAMLLFMKKHFMHKVFSIRFYLVMMGMRLRQGVAFIQLPFKNLYSSKTVIPFFIKGHIDKSLKERLTQYDIPVSETDDGKRAIVFCENNSLSWKKIIETITQESKGNIYYFHGSGTHALVSSHSKAKQGEIIVL